MRGDIEVEVVFNKGENGFEAVSDALDRLTRQSGGYWDFGTGFSALGSCSKEALEALCDAVQTMKAKELRER